MAAIQRNCGSNIRRLLDDVPLLQQFRIFGTAATCGLDALLVAPVKRIDKLVILDSEIDGSDIDSYYHVLSLEFADHLKEIARREGRMCRTAWWSRRLGRRGEVWECLNVEVVANSLGVVSLTGRWVVFPQDKGWSQVRVDPKFRGDVEAGGVCDTG